MSIASAIAPVDENNVSSAEWIAYNLIQKISKQNAIAPDLQWIVTESDQVPQNMLPMPTTTTSVVSPDDGELNVKGQKVRMRGTLDWAPPRKQVIFNIVPRVRRNVQIPRQNFRCAGCGLHVEKSQVNRMLYCHYTGKYFCRYNCHSQKRSPIPAMVLNKWDFTSYPVSNFAHNLIDKIRGDQLFNIQDINPNLYKKSKTLHRITELRTQLASLKEYVQACKRGGNVLLGFLIFTPKHMANTTDVHTYSLDDLILIKSDTKLVERLNELVKLSICHVSGCGSCQARGFYCEVCTKSSSGRKTPTNAVKDVIFPFEVGRVTMCPTCRACYHSKCFTATSCLKCERIKKRKEKLNQPSPDSPDSEEIEIAHDCIASGSPAS